MKKKENKLNESGYRRFGTRGARSRWGSVSCSPISPCKYVCVVHVYIAQRRRHFVFHGSVNNQKKGLRENGQDRKKNTWLPVIIPFAVAQSRSHLPVCYIVTIHGRDAGHLVMDHAHEVMYLIQFYWFAPVCGHDACSNDCSPRWRGSMTSDNIRIIFLFFMTIFPSGEGWDCGRLNRLELFEKKKSRKKL